MINEATSTDAGVTLSASYGFVDTTANFGFASSNSQTDTQRSATSFARDTTLKAVSKLQKRTLERKFTRTFQETEETNRHTFDNKAGTGDISGTYRFVDKIYNAQVVNYGKRLMLEFVVPEPAAFFRFAKTKQPIDVVAEKPDVPGYCLSNGKKFVPLQVSDISRSSYLIWAAKYGAEDISPAPPHYRIIGRAFSKEGSDLLKDSTNPSDHLFWHSENSLFNIDTGYIPHTVKTSVDFAFIDIKDGDGESKNQRITVQFGEHKKTFRASNTYNPNDDIDSWEHRIDAKNTNGIGVTISSFGVRAFGITFTVLCTLSPERYEEWRIKTYNAIMSAYYDQKTKYDNAVEAEKIRDGFTPVMGTNPAVNREIERTELKKSCISLLTGQSFDSFDAMALNVGTYGYPEIDFEEAAYEGKFISYFEQAFEWNNMTYLFYPYFWANKSQWLFLSQLNDNDPIFTKFLQAGSCRVNVPVRREFEAVMLNYLNLNVFWGSDGVLVNADDNEPIPSVYLSLIEELKSELNNMGSEGTGRLNVTNGSNTVTGIGTAFDPLADVNKRLIIAGKIYVIQSVSSSTSLLLNAPYTGPSATEVQYTFGARLEGNSWEVKLPTNLVKLADFPF